MFHRKRAKFTQDEIDMSKALCHFTRSFLQLDLPAEIATLIAELAKWNLDWNRVKTHESFLIFEENPSIIRLMADKTWHVAVADTIFESGFKYSCSVRVISLCVPLLSLLHHLASSFGVVPVHCNVASTSHLMISWPQVGGWEWWNSDGSARHHLHSAEYGADDVSADDVITMCVDFTKETMSSSGKGTLSFSRGTDQYGIAFDNVIPPVHPAVSLYSKGSSLEIMSISRIDC